MVGVTPCPQKVGDFFFTSAGSQTVNVTGNDPTGTVSFSPNPLTLAPGERKSVAVFFLCTTRSSFGIDVNFTVSTGLGGQFDILKGTVRGVLR